MATQVDPQELVTASRCFECLSPATQEEIQTLIFATAAGLSTDPNELLSLSRCMSCLSYQTLLEIKTFLLASNAGLSTDPNVRASESRCYSCIPEGMLSTVQTYLLAQDPASPSTNPQTLARLVRCWSCVPHPSLLEVQVYILARMYGVSTDPSVLAGLARCFSCLPFPVLQYALTEVIDVIEGDGGMSGCTPDIPVLSNFSYPDGVLFSFDATVQCPCPDGGDWVLYGSNNADGSGGVEQATYAQGSTTGPLTETIPIPQPTPAFDYFYVTQRCAETGETGISQVLATNGGPCGVASTVIEVTGAGDADANGYYVTTDGTTFTNATSLYTIVFDPNSQPVAGDAYLLNDLAVPLYYLPSTECFPCGEWLLYPAGSPTAPAPTMVWVEADDPTYLANAWADRVVANGGVRPSNTSINAAVTFLGALESASISSKILHLNFIAPDNYIAARTPLIATVGNTLWGEVGAAADWALGVNGIKRNVAGSTMSFDTGINPTTAFSSQTSAGICIYKYDGVNEASGWCAVRETAGSDTVVFGQLLQDGGQRLYGYIYELASRTVDTLFPVTFIDGYFSTHRTASTANDMYRGTSGGHAKIGTRNVAVGASRPNRNLYFPGMNNGGSPIGNDQGTRSFFAVTLGLTQAEDLALFNAVQALRTALGGGYV